MSNYSMSKRWQVVVMILSFTLVVASFLPVHATQSEVYVAYTSTSPLALTTKYVFMYADGVLSRVNRDVSDGQPVEIKQFLLESSFGAIYSHRDELWFVSQDEASHTFLTVIDQETGILTDTSFQLPNWPVAIRFQQDKVFFSCITDKNDMQVPLYKLDLQTGNMSLINDKTVIFLAGDAENIYYVPLNKGVSEAGMFITDSAPPYSLYAYHLASASESELSTAVDLPVLFADGDYFVTINAPKDREIMYHVSLISKTGTVLESDSLLSSIQPRLLANQKYVVIQTQEREEYHYHVFDYQLSQINEWMFPVEDNWQISALGEKHLYFVNANNDGDEMKPTFAYLPLFDESDSLVRVNLNE